MTPTNAWANGPQPKLRCEFNRDKQTFLFRSLKPPTLRGKPSVNSPESPPLHLLENTKLHYMDPDDPLISLSSTTGAASRHRDSLQVLADEVHASHLSRQSEYVSGKTTDKKYQNRVREYLEWWEEDQACQCEAASTHGSSWVTILAQPITAMKVALYLDYASNRPQVSLIFISLY